MLPGRSKEFNNYLRRSIMRIRLMFLIITVLFLTITISSAQSTGDYRSAGKGKWNDSTTWQRYNGSAWVAASARPDSNAAVITISASDTVFIDTISTVRNSSVVVHGYLKDTTGLILSNASVTFNDGSTYEYAHPAGTYGIPTATWNSGSTCLITGVTSSTTSINGKQNFHHLIVNAPAWSGNLNFGWSSDTVTIKGNITVISTGASGRWQLSAPTSGNTAVINILGNVTMSGGQFTTNGTSNANTHIVVNHFGNITVTAGNFSISRGSQGGTGTATWNLHGNFSMSGATTQNSNAAGAKFVFAKNGKQSLSLGTGNTLTALPLFIKAGSFVDLGSSLVKGSGNFTVDSGAAIATKRAEGFDSNIVITGTLALSKNASYAYTGSDSQKTGLIIPDSVMGLVISNGVGVSLSDSLVVAKLSVDSGAVFNITKRLRAGGMDIYGTVVNTDTLYAGGTNTFYGGSVYRHAINGGSMPVSTWNNGSTLEITGVTANAPSNGNQNFHHVIWNCPSQTANLNMGWKGNVIGGNISVISTGTGRWQMCAPQVDSSVSVTLNGNVSVAAGQFTTNGTSNANSHITINHYGNINTTGGNFSISRGSQGGTGTAVWNLFSGDVSMINTTTQNSNAVGAKFVFAKQGTQKLVFGGSTFAGGGMPIQVKTGTTLDLDTNIIGGTGAFVLDSGTTLISGHIGGVNGNVATGGTVTLHPYANYVFNGDTIQVTGSLLTPAANSVGIDNAKGVALSAPLALSGTLTLRNGKLSLGTSHLTATGISSSTTAKYIVTNGTGSLKLKNVGNTETLFPVGTTTAYAPVSIVNAGTVDNFAVNVTGDTANGANRVRVKWAISEETAAGTTADLQFGWMASLEGGNFAAKRNDASKIFRLSDSTEAGSGIYSKQLSTEPYTVARGGFTSMGTFMVGSIKGPIVGIESSVSLVPAVFELYQNYPNPFNPETTIKFTVEKSGTTSLELYNALGQHVSTLFSGAAEPGRYYTVRLNASTLASGMYFNVLKSGSQKITKKILVVK